MCWRLLNLLVEASGDFREILKDTLKKSPSRSLSIYLRVFAFLLQPFNLETNQKTWSSLTFWGSKCCALSHPACRRPWAKRWRRSWPSSLARRSSFARRDAVAFPCFRMCRSLEVLWGIWLCLARGYITRVGESRGEQRKTLPRIMHRPAKTCLDRIITVFHGASVNKQWTTKSHPRCIYIYTICMYHPGGKHS